MEVKPTNNPEEIAKIYSEHRVSSNVNISGGEMEVKSLMKDFF